MKIEDVDLMSILDSYSKCQFAWCNCLGNMIYKASLSEITPHWLYTLYKASELTPNWPGVMLCLVVLDVLIESQSMIYKASEITPYWLYTLYKASEITPNRPGVIYDI